MKTNDVASVVLLECFREIRAGLETKETLLLVPQDSCSKIIICPTCKIVDGEYFVNHCQLKSDLRSFKVRSVL